MVINQDWFEFKDIKKRDFSRDSWIPLRSVYKPLKKGVYGYLGFEEELIFSTSIAFASELIPEASKLTWDDIGLCKNQSAYVDKGIYYPAESYNHWTNKSLIGTHLVIDQPLPTEEGSIWHLNQDVVIALKLIREGNSWFSPDDGYEEAVRIKLENGRPVLLEIKSTFLKDYLCARNMDLIISSYRCRKIIYEDSKIVNWKKAGIEEKTESYKFVGRTFDIHEGGNIFGSSVAILHIARTDVDSSEDVPILSHPTDADFKTKSSTKKFNGKKLCVVNGDFWRTEVFKKGEISVRVREDKNPDSYSFIIEASGEKQLLSSLKDSGRWLWFKPEIIMALAHRRGGALGWYTAETGKVSSSKNSPPVHFGINKIGYINVFAKDLSCLFPWEQIIWASYNVTPDGGISDELQDSQVSAKPANTQAPERFLPRVLKELNEISQCKWGFDIIRDHNDLKEILTKTHRFRSIDKNGLFSLAKDLARLTADSFNTSEIQKILSKMPETGKFSSLKTVEKLIALKIPSEEARSILSPLVGAYELRHGDAHLAGSIIEDAYKLVEIKPNEPFVIQGQKMLCACVDSLYLILDVLQRWEIEE
jgi:hypothetical protein